MNEVFGASQNVQNMNEFFSNEIIQAFWFPNGNHLILDEQHNASFFESPELRDILKEMSPALRNKVYLVFQNY